MRKKNIEGVISILTIIYSILENILNHVFIHLGISFWGIFHTPN